VYPPFEMALGTCVTNGTSGISTIMTCDWSNQQQALQTTLSFPSPKVLPFNESAEYLLLDVYDSSDCSGSPEHISVILDTCIVQGVDAPAYFMATVSSPGECA
jgi:hypothetical protein